MILTRFWRATKSVAHPEYTFIGIADGLFPELLLVTSGRLFVATASIIDLCKAFVHIRKVQPKTLVELCGFFTSTPIDQLQRALSPDTGDWVCWHVMEPGQIWQTPAGHVRAEGN